MEYYDINCFVGRWRHHLDFETLEALRAEMARLGITRALVSHTSAWLSHPSQGNEALVEELSDHTGLRPVIALTPLLDMEFGGGDAIEAFMQSNDVAAIRLYPKDHKFTLHPFNVAAVFELAGRLQLPIMVDSKQLAGRYELLYELTKAWPGQPLVLLQTPYRFARVMYPLFDKCPNLYSDMAVFMGYRAVKEFTSHFGAERLLFSTYMPFNEGAMNVGLLAYADISQADKEKIAYKNAERLFDKRRSGDGENS